MSNLKYFMIYGERCSGTNFLQQCILENFNLKYTDDGYDHRHFFGFQDFKNNEVEDQTLFLGIIRNPIDWIYSFYNNQHYVPTVNSDLKNFLFNNFYSVKGGGKEGELIKEDLNYETKQKYKNIFELRKMKNRYLLDIMPTKVKNYVLISYDDLKTNTIEILNKLKLDFGLEQKQSSIVGIDYYKDEKDRKYEPRDSIFSNNVMKAIIKNVNMNQERRINQNIDVILSNIVKKSFVKNKMLLKSLISKYKK